LVFCREAPPEFNDHQRDVFCVFSGGGVGRLRDFLNNEKALQLAGDNSSAPPSISGDNDNDMGIIDVDLDDENVESDGSNTPVVNIDVHGSHRAGLTPVVPMPGPISGLLFSSQQHHNTGWQHHHSQNNHSHHNGAAGPSAQFSSSAPATTAGGIWPTHLSHAQPSHYHGGAQHVTGMMGAAALDDVDEGDEAFGENSEIMDD